MFHIESEEEEDEILLDRNVSLLLGGRSYDLRLILRPDYDVSSGALGVEVDARHDGNKVGYLTGHLLKRPRGNFYQCADAISGELQELSVIFCDSRGIASRVDHPRLKEAPRCIYSGGFYHIEKVEVKPDHRGHDLGLRIIHESLLFLKNDWSLVVMQPGPLSHRSSKWPVGVGVDDLWRELSPEQEEAISMASHKISVHYARMGFVQAGRTPRLCSSWFMTSQFYFPSEVTDPNDAIKRWIPKTAAMATIDVYVRPKKVIPTGLDKELLEAVQRAMNSFFLISPVGLGSCAASSGADLMESFAKIENLLQQGASIQRSRALHFAAANSRDDDAKVLEALIRLAGGEVDNRDENGNTPLHVAAGAMAQAAVSMLVIAGANLEATNLEGNTPEKCLMNTIQSTNDFSKCFSLSMPPRAVDVIPKLACAKALMTPAAQSSLIDGWLSPRMKKLLLITAEINGDEITDVIGDETQCMRYIPLEIVLQGRKESSKRFSDGWGAIFCCIADLLRRGMTPTCNHIQDTLVRQANQNYQFFIEKGGRIEYALDAILGITENVYNEGDDGYEYVTFEDDIEALPSTPLDWQFDIARFMCFERGGGVLTERGPYRMFDDDFEMEDEDNDSMNGDY
jgi:hypothetical protein